VSTKPLQQTCTTGSASSVFTCLNDFSIYSSSSGFLAKADISSYSRIRLARIFGLAFMPGELLSKARLRIGSPPEGTHWNLKFPAATKARHESRLDSLPRHDGEHNAKVLDCRRASNV
jgi:hypothetical protein